MQVLGKLFKTKNAHWKDAEETNDCSASEADVERAFFLYVDIFQQISKFRTQEA